MEVSFYNVDEVDDSLLEFAVIVSRYKGKWIFCKHKNRTTWEVPGGHREEGETIWAAAERELFEETGAVKYDITAICVYSVKREAESYGMLFFAEIAELGELPEKEIERISFFQEIPNNLTYPFIQPKLMIKAIETMT